MCVSARTRERVFVRAYMCVYVCVRACVRLVIVMRKTSNVALVFIHAHKLVGLFVHLLWTRSSTLMLLHCTLWG